MRNGIRFVLAATSVALLLFGATQAMGGEEQGEVKARGQCSAESVWKLAMAREVGVSLEVNLETGVDGQLWDVTAKYNQHVEIRQTFETEEDGGFEIRKVENNAVGEDVLNMVAVNRQTGETCRGMLTTEL